MIREVFVQHKWQLVHLTNNVDQPSSFPRHIMLNKSLNTTVWS